MSINLVTNQQLTSVTNSILIKGALGTCASFET